MSNEHLIIIVWFAGYVPGAWLIAKRTFYWLQADLMYPAHSRVEDSRRAALVGLIGGIFWYVTVAYYVPVLLVRGFARLVRCEAGRGK